MKDKKTASDVGEFGLIQRIEKIIGDVRNDKIILGIGDDTAVINAGSGKVQLITCDIQIEGQHFHRDFLSSYQLGRRAMAVNLSDIAAMGGRPTFALVSLGLPADFPADDFNDLFRGFRDQMAEFDAHIIGGNLARSENNLIIDITMLGEAKKGRFLTRSGAKSGDRIFVSGSLGSAAAGVFLLVKFGKNYPVKFERILHSYRQPIPRILLGQKLADSGLVSAMMDISDGLAGDLNHICEQSNCGAVIFEEKIPLESDLKEISGLIGKPVLDLALFGGEDYELLFTVKKDSNVEKIKAAANELRIAIHEIGFITEEKGLYMQNSKGVTTHLPAKGWDHFHQEK